MSLALPDQTVSRSAGALTVDLSAHFTDPDSGDTLTYAAASSVLSVATVQVSGSTLTITPAAAGASTVTVTATDPHGLSASDNFVFTVAANRVPTVSPIPDQSIPLSGGEVSIGLAAYFTDPDSGDTLTYVASSTQVNVVGVSVSGAVLRLTPRALGASTVRVTASDGEGGSVSDDFTVTVTAAANRAPRVVRALSDVTVQVDRISAQQISGVFDDPDGDHLTYTASSSDLAKATASVTSSTVTVTGVAVGQAAITVTALDGRSGTAATSFVATVTAVPQPNRPPQLISTGLPDVLTKLRLVGGAAQFNLSTYFMDPDGDVLTYVASSSASATATVAVSDGVLTITPLAVGTAEISVTASDPSRRSVSDSMSVEVTLASNTAPTVANPLSDRTVSLAGGVVELQLSPVFSDAEGDPLSYAATSSATRVALVLVTRGSILEITPRSAGTATIAVTATDTGRLSVTDAFELTVSPNGAPRIDGSGLPDKTMRLAAGAAQVELGPHFSDPDGDALSYAAVSSAVRLATVAVSGSVLTITPLAAAGAGELSISVTATDGGGLGVTDTFAVVITEAPNNAPVLGDPIADRTLSVGGGSAEFSLARHFRDPDGDTLTFTATSSATGVATAVVSGSILTVAPVASGPATISVTATDPDGASVTLTFTVTVTAVNRPPAVATPIAPVEVQLGHTAKVSIAAAFTDTDSTSLEYAVTSGRTDIATAVLGGTVITIRGLKLGSATITVTADDGNAGPGRPARQTFEVTVVPGPVNQPPRVATPIAAVEVQIGRTATVSISAAFTDEDDSSLTYAATSGRADIASVVLVGTTITIRGLSVGSATVTVTADDGNAGPNRPARQTFEVTVVPGPVNQPPEIAAELPDVTVTLGSTVLVNIAAAFTDPEGDPLTARASSDRPDVASLSSSGTIIRVTGESLGTATVTVRVTDGVAGPGRPVMQDFAVTVDEVPNTPPELVGEIPDIEVGIGLTVPVVAEFVDAEGDRLTFTVVSGRRDVVSVRPSWSGGTIDIAVTGESPGTAVVSITANDGRASAHASFTVTVESMISAPTNLAWRTESATSGTLSWTPPRIGRDEVTHYEVRYTGGSAGTLTAETPGVAYARLAGLETGCRYSAEVRGVARGGGPVVDDGPSAAAVEGEWSDPYSFAIPPAGACDAVAPVIGSGTRGQLVFPPGGSLPFRVEPAPPSAFALEVRLSVGPDFVLSVAGGGPAGAVSVVVPPGSDGVDIELREKTPYFRHSENVRAVVDAVFVGPPESGGTLDEAQWPVVAIRSNRIPPSTVEFAHDGNGMARAALGDWARLYVLVDPPLPPEAGDLVAGSRVRITQLISPAPARPECAEFRGRRLPGGRPFDPAGWLPIPAGVPKVEFQVRLGHADDVPRGCPPVTSVRLFIEDRVEGHLLRRGRAAELHVSPDGGVVVPSIGAWGVIVLGLLLSYIGFRRLRETGGGAGRRP